MASGTQPQPADSLIKQKITSGAKIVGFANIRYLTMKITNVNDRYGAVLAVNKSGITHFSISGDAPTTTTGSTTTATYDSSTGTYEFDFGSQYQQGFVIAGGSIADGDFTLHN